MEAFSLNENWLERHPQDQSARLDFAEKHFTTDKFIECEQRIMDILDNPDIGVSSKAALQAVGIANSIAQQKAEHVNSDLQTMISTVLSEPDSFRVGWSFNGTTHFIETSENENLATHRNWLLSLFQALEGENRDTILVSLREVQASWQVVAGKNK